MKYPLLNISALLLIFFTAADAHPLKMAYTTVKYDELRKVYLITHRVFQDDFENTLKEKYGYSGGDIYLNQSNTKVQLIINQFFGKNFTLSFNQVKQPLKFINIEQKNQMGIVIHYETSGIPPDKIRSVQVYNYIMMESFSEQVNMFNFQIEGKVKRTFAFDSEHTRETFNL